MASNSNKSKCCKCERIAVLLITDEYNRDCMCSKCYLVYKPPVLCLDKYDTNKYLWNRTQDRRELLMDIEDFLKCGWFLRRIEEFESKVPKYHTKRIYLEYYGDDKCIRVAEYYEKLFLGHLSNCKKPRVSCKKCMIK